MSGTSAISGGVIAARHDAQVVVPDLRTQIDAVRQENLIEHGFSPLWRGVVHVLSALPLVGDTQVIKQAAADIAFIRTTRETRLKDFVNALRETHDSTVVDTAVTITALSGTDYLSLSKIREVRELVALGENIRHAQQYVNRVEVKVWNWVDMNRVGRVSLMVKHPLSSGPTTRSPDDTAESYLSWTPQLGPRPRVTTTKSLGRRIADYLTSRPFSAPPISKRTFNEDMYHQISDKTRENLDANAVNAKTGFMPRPGQVEVPVKLKPDLSKREVLNVTRENHWGQEPDASIAIPLAGINHKPSAAKAKEDLDPPNKPPMTTFGLSGEHMLTYWDDVTSDKREQFSALSPDRNSSGMTASVLKAGGAEAFLPIPRALIFQDPNTMRGYAENLMVEVAALNLKSDQVDAAFGHFSVSRSDVEQNDVLPSHQALLDDAQHAIASLPPAARSSMQTLSNALTACRPVAADFEGMMRQLKTLVTGLHTQINGPFDPRVNDALAPAYALYTAIRIDAHQQGEVY